ncbi:hypothetical protein CTI12_AA486910 [Artemisia annua]|uniref:Nicalin n=1 Tax=Artemisia annua TaxID=35608 RepID=A0A2U1LHX1_ARTAN|nr:hypothetical protein CTI12_AA486910 [Artemisia annua]
MESSSSSLKKMYSMIIYIILIAAAVSLSVELCDASTVVVDVYRLIQYDIAGSPFGSRLASLNHHAASSSLLLSSTTDLSRACLTSVDDMAEYIEQGKPLGGLLLLLPQILRPERSETVGGHDSFDKENLKKQLVDLEQKLIHATINGWLPGSKADGDSNQLPTIAIVASYDTFGAAPALSVGSDSNGSGVVALLEIARLFSILYSNPNTRGRYNILFGLTSGGPYNYNGTQKVSFDQRLRESIDYAICLNSLGSAENELWLHVSKPPENAYVKQIFEGLSNVAEELGVTVGLKHKKINVSNSRSLVSLLLYAKGYYMQVAWEHEQFSRLRVTAATLSGLSAPPDLLESTGGVSDNRELVNEAAVVKSVKVVAESLARHIYGQQGKNINIFADNSSLAVNPSYIRSWLDLMSRTPRVAPFLSKDSAFITALKKELADHVVEVNLQHDLLDGMFTFYDSTVSTLQIYQVASVTFDLLLLLGLGSYLITLFSLLVITTRGLDDLISLFRRPPSRKVKSA